MAKEPGQKDEEVGRGDSLLSKKLVRLAIAVGVVLAVGLLVSLGFALRWYFSPQTDLSISQRQALVQGLASAGQALAVLFTGAVGLIGLYLTRQNTNKQLRQARDSTQEQLQQARESQERTQASAQETLRLTEQGQITERFTRAIEQLGATDDKGEKKLEIRLGGIYALERIASDSPMRDYSTVMEVLTAYVRENTPKAPRLPEGLLDPPSESRRPTADIQAILDVLSRAQTRVPEEYRTRLDLSEATLEEADLQNANLQGAILYGTDLHRSILSGANLEEADLQSANLQRATLLQDAILKGANIFGANLQRAILLRADLQNANLQLARLQQALLKGTNLQGGRLLQAYLEEANLEEANLRNANLKEANLRNANLEKAKLQGANLQGANLQGANLQGARLYGANVTKEQLADTQSLQGATMPDGSEHP
jgi:uncharacterized protein YjbI with pentapeptide repeats